MNCLFGKYLNVLKVGFTIIIFIATGFSVLYIAQNQSLAREDDRPWYEFDMNWNSRKRGKQEETALKLGFEVSKNESDCRQLPDILIIGFEKCGTMTLRQFLGLHPSIFITKKRGNNDCFDEDESRAPIQCVADRPCTDIGQLRLEKLGMGGEPEKVFRYLPNVKLFVIVREPVERTMSHFVDVKARSKIPDAMDFEQFLKNFFAQNKTYSKNVRHLYTYTRLIRQWIQLFGKEKILVLDGDEFARNPVVELRKAEVFLGLNSYFNEDVFVYNETRKFYCFKTDTGNECMYAGKGRPHPVMRNETRAFIKTLFHSLNEEFFQLIGRRFPWDDT